MKKLIMVAAMLAMVVAVGVVPAMAAGRHGGGFDRFNPNAAAFFFSDPNAFFDHFNRRNDFNRNNLNNGGGGSVRGSPSGTPAATSTTRSRPPAAGTTPTSA